jgi:DNA mismatch repair protein MSH2
VLRHLGRQGSQLDSVTMSITVFRNFLREALFRLGKRIQIYESQNRGAWKVTKQASPGNLQDVEDQLGENIGESAPMILAVKVGSKSTESRQVGVCFADASVRELGVSEFADNESYSNFESLIIQLGIKECIVQIDVSGKDLELSKIRSIADNCGCAVTPRSGGDFATRDVEDDLNRLLRDGSSTSRLPQSDLKLAMGSSAALIKYLALMSNSSNFGQYALYQHDLAQYMKLDAPALRALNLMPGPRDGSKTMSLFGLLNHCKTPMGPRLLAQWLKQPLMSTEAIKRRQDLVESFVTDTELRQTMQEDHLRSIPDMYRLAKKFQRKKAGLEDVVRAYQASTRLPGIIGTLEAVMDEKYKDPLDEEYTRKFEEINNSLGKFQELVETTIDLEALDNHEYIIKHEFDDNLRVIKTQLESTRAQMQAEHRKVGRDLSLDTEKKLLMENTKVNGWCFRVTRAVSLVCS